MGVDQYRRTADTSSSAAGSSAWLTILFASFGARRAVRDATKAADWGRLKRLGTEPSTRMRVKAGTERCCAINALNSNLLHSGRRDHKLADVRADPGIALRILDFTLEARVSFQSTILKVLAGHPEGRASLADLTRYVSVLTSSGTDWSQRMKRLAARVPGLDIFTSGYVLRQVSGWQITDADRELLRSIEAAPGEPASEPAAPEPAEKAPLDLPPNVVHLVGYKFRQRRRAAA